MLFRSRPGPLSDLIVVDLTRYLSGPYCSLLLADLGARVIKIETPGTGDDSRYVPPGVDGKSAYFMSINRGKESIALDLKKEADRAVLDQLIAGADILVERRTLRRSARRARPRQAGSWRRGAARPET